MGGASIGAPWASFYEAAYAALKVLHARIGLDVWLMTEVVGEEQVVLAAFPRGVIDEGTALPWDTAFCRRMVSGEGPRVAGVVAAVPVYAGLRMVEGFVEGFKVSAYVGVPLTLPDGTLFGTLCGVAGRAQGPGLARDLPFIELVAGLLSTVLAGGEPLEARSQPGDLRVRPTDTRLSGG